MTRLTDPINLREISVSLKLPYLGEVSGTWEPDESERKAAWEMYVELVTRISISELGPTEGLLREALSSLYALFAVTRGLLRQYGPVVAQPKKGGHLSFGYLAVAVLNTVLRPLLAHWHPRLLDYESRKPADLSPVEWEQQWPEYAALHAALEAARVPLAEYADLLAQVAGVPSLIFPTSTPARVE